MEMPRKVVGALVAVLLIAGCGADSTQAPSAPVDTAPLEAKPSPPPSTPIPDRNGKLVDPVRSTSSRPEKAWMVPDAIEGGDQVSAADAEYLAAARPSVPYRTQQGGVSNATLIAIGRKACAPAASYQAGGITVEGPPAGVVHRAALIAYC